MNLVIKYEGVFGLFDSIVAMLGGDFEQVGVLKGEELGETSNGYLVTFGG